jgi:A/G-specific adenine glycosylase
MQASGESIDRNFATSLLAWYDVHARVLPWRSPPGSPPPAPYRVWLSEVMLQQTTVAAAAPYFERFTSRWPTVEALAAAEEGEVMSAWGGLGYYSRARNLVACARQVVERGGFPEDEAGLRMLPGIGAYTSAAIAAIAFGRSAFPVDANIERVLARLFAIPDKAAVRRLPERIALATRHGDFAQGLMDLGATVCTARAPKCLACPLRKHCKADAAGEPERYPAKPLRKPKPLRRGRTYWIVRGDAVRLVRRPPRGLLGGTLALPDDGWSSRADGSSGLAGDWQAVGSVRHGFTHFDLELEVVGGSGQLPAGEWWPLARLGEAGLPTLFAKASKLALG